MQAEATQFPITRQGVRDLDAGSRTSPAMQGGSSSSKTSLKNVGDRERAVSLLVGGGLIGACLARPSIVNLTLGLLGGGFVFRGWTGHCDLYQTLVMNTAGSSPR